MTTKNSEILFDLQRFENSIIPSAATPLAATMGGFTGSNMASIGAGTGSSITISGGWAVNDAVTVNNVYSDYGTSSETFLSVSGYDHNATFTYYGFSTVSGSYVIDTLSSVTLPSDSSSTTYTAQTTALFPSGVAFNNSVKASSVTVAGGGSPTGVSLQGVGTISEFGEGQRVVLARAGNQSLNLTGVQGTVALSATGDTLKQNFNGASINAINLYSPVTIEGGSSWSTAPTLSSSNYVSLGSVDSVQTWSVSSGISYASVNANVATGNDPIIAKGSSSVAASNYLNITVNSGNAVQLSASGTGNTPHDTIGVNGTIIAGAAKAYAEIAAGDESSVLTAAIGSADASINVGGTPTLNGAASVAAGANVTIATTGISGHAVITAIDTLAANGAWSLGAYSTIGQLGVDTVNFASASGVITANADGTKVAALANGGNVTLSGVGDHTLTANGGAWTLNATATDASVASTFDSSGNATVDGATLISGANKSLAIGANGANDTMSLGGASQVTLNADGYVTAVNSLAAGSSWLVRNGESREVSIGSSNIMDIKFSNPASSGVFGEITTNTLSGGGASVAAIDSLSGNVTVTSASSSISGLNVAGTTWSVSNPNGNTVDFNSTGKLAALTASNSSTDLTVIAAATDASVVVSLTGDTMGGSFNGAKVYVHDGDSIVGVQLESDTSAMGITGITSLNSGATVIGDNEYKVNENFAIRKGNNTTTQFTLGGSSSMTVQNVVDGDAYTVVGASGSTVVYDVDSTVTSGGQAKVSVNSAAVTVTASTDSSVNGVYISANYGDDIAKVEGVKLNDTISSSGDKNFSVIYDTSNVSSSSTDTYVMTVNDVRVSLKAGNIANIGTAVTMAVDNSSTMPNINISSGIANSSTVTVGRGVYSVGSSAAVTVNDAIGFLYVDENGNVTAEDSIVADIRRERDGAIESLVSSLHGSASTANAFHDFYNIYYGNNTVFGDWPYTVASYENATVSTHSASISSTGVNIYGEKSLSDYPNSVTLQSFLGTPIDVEHIEGRVSGTATLSNAVIDVSNSTNSLVAVGMNSSYDNFAVNHTILGSARNSTLIVGEGATGDNVVRGGNGGNYMVHRGNGKATLVGGTGSDTVYAVAGDSVVGGTGADYFYDSSAFEISDYNFDEKDVIIATKLSNSANLTRANISVDGNKLAVAGGSTLTIGASDQYDESTATKAIVANAANSSSNRSLLIWAGIYDSTVDATEFEKGALIISDNNEGAADSVYGSAYADVAYVGGNDLINAGAGNDTINIASVSADSGRRGATVVLSTGKNDVNGWTGGFDNESGSNIIAFETNASTAADINFKTKSGVVVGYAEGSSLNFNSLSPSSGNSGAYDFLVGQEKVTFIASDQTVNVLSDDAIADYYKGEKAAGIYVGESVTTGLAISLGSANFTNVTKLDLHNESRASVIGTAANESITLVGSADAGASKSVAAGAGNDYIVSGGNSTTNAGNYLFFGTYNNYTYSSGRDTVENFGFYRGAANDMDLANADVLYLGDTANYKGLTATASKLEISLGDSDKVIINDNFSTSDNKMLRARFGNDETTYLCKFGLTSGYNTFTYDGETNAFFGNTGRGRDTLNVASDLNNVSIWLNDRNYDQKFYYGINVINAGNLTDAKSTLVGSSADSNLIYSAGNGSTNSLWGGGGESNTLIGGNGDDTFFYYKSVGYVDSDGVGHASNDVIQGVQNNDLIWMADVTLDDIALADIESGKITITLKDGSALTVTGMSTETSFRLSDGQGGTQDYTAVSSGSDRHWE